MSRRLNEDFYLQQQQQQQCSSEAQTVKTFSEKIITKTYKKALYPGGKGGRCFSFVFYQKLRKLDYTFLVFYGFWYTFGAQTAWLLILFLFL